MKLTRDFALLTVALLTFSFFGCARPNKTVMGEAKPAATAPKADTAAATGDLTVLAAASLSKPFDDLGAEFEKQNPGIKYKGSYAGTQELLAQMESGAKADVFASASEEHMSAAVVKKLVREPKAFATNSLCIAVSPHAANVTSLKDLAKPGVKVVVAVEKSPIGKYTRKVLDKIAADKGFGPDVVKGIKANVKSEETDVKLVLSRVSLGEADAGFVYKSDAVSAGDKVRLIEIPGELNVTASYPLAVCATAPNPDPAAKFVELVLSQQGQDILRKYGFQPPGPKK